MADIEALLDEAIEREGAYVNHPDDRGGPTRWGVTQAVARKHGYFGDMKTLPRETAKSIYRDEYWHQPGFARVATVFPVVAAELFDTGINMGTGVAAQFLQRAINVLTNAELKVDGVIGARTIEALKGYASKRKHQNGEAVLVKVLDCLQGERYVTLVERRSRNRSFIFGWLAHRIGQAT